MKEMFQLIDRQMFALRGTSAGARPLLVLILSLGGWTTGFSQQVGATLSQESTAVGQPVQFTVSVEGARGAQVPQTLQIDGLDARYSGKSEQMQMQFGSGGYRRTVTASYTYLIVPLREGSFTIPAIPVQVDGKTLKTQPLTLRVTSGQGGSIPVLPAMPTQPGIQGTPSSSQNPQARSSPGEPAERKSVFGELLVPKTTAFAGEVIPVEIRFYFDARYQARLQDRPGFSGNGFTVMDLSKPIERRQDIDGVTYNVVSFQTAITPAKSGPLEIPGATLEAQIQSPSTQRRDDFFGGLFGQMMETRPVTITTDPTELEVKPLPREGRPENFGGAIGQFSLAATASPKKVAANDPVSLHVTVAGRGNFEGMSAPELVDADGWRTYPPGENFVPSASDPIGFNGEKRFEFMLLARKDQTATPVAEFSFFDPAMEKYVTLKTAPVPVIAQGGAAPAATPAAVASAAPSAPPSPAGVAPASEATGLVQNFETSTFVPLLVRPWVRVINGTLAAIWALIFLVAVGRKWANSPRAREAAALRETRQILKSMEDPALEPNRFFQWAEEFVRARLTGLGETSSGEDLRAKLAGASLAPETRQSVQEILDRHDAARYSTVTVPLDADERQIILNHLKAFDLELQK